MYYVGKVSDGKMVRRFVQSDQFYQRIRYHKQNCGG